ncbi:MAG: sugar phosphate isomerase/epimerase [Clostridia bacterium]|nr:sugar phosphate isomerase/epimerase [Clostridia bacterium]
MLLGINTSSFGESGMPKYWKENSYEKAKEFGYSCVDFSILGDTNSMIYSSDKATREKILLREKMLAEKAGLKINQAHAPVLSLERALSEQEIATLLQNIKIAIESCKTLDCKYLVVHPFMPNGWSDRGTVIAEDTFNKNVSYLQELGAYAKEYDVTLCYENMPCIGFSISTPDEILAVLKAVNLENVKMCLDTGHLSAFSPELHLGSEIRKCGKYIKTLHVHDNHGRSDQHNFPGMGMADWKDGVKALHEIGFDGVFSLELLFPDKFSEQVFENACRLAASMADEIVNGLYE